MADGSGVARLYPALNDLDTSRVKINSLPCIIKNGIQSDTSAIQMIGLAHLSDVEINNIINYILNDMNGIRVEMPIIDTKEYLKNCD